MSRGATDQDNAGGARPRRRRNKGRLLDGRNLCWATIGPRISSEGRTDARTAVACSQ